MKKLFHICLLLIVTSTSSLAADKSVHYTGQLKVIEEVPGYYLLVAEQLSFYNVFIQAKDESQHQHLKSLAERGAVILVRGKGFDRNFHQWIIPDLVFTIEIPRKK